MRKKKLFALMACGIMIGSLASCDGITVNVNGTDGVSVSKSDDGNSTNESKDSTEVDEDNTETTEVDEDNTETQSNTETQNDDGFYVNVDGKKIDSVSPETHKEVSEIIDDLPDASLDSDSSSGSTADGYTNDELCRLAKKYYKKHYKETPPIVEVDSEDGDNVTLHLYEQMSDHTATLAWYTVSRKTAKGTDGITCEDIDLTK